MYARAQKRWLAQWKIILIRIDSLKMSFIFNFDFYGANQISEFILCIRYQLRVSGSDVKHKRKNLSFFLSPLYSDRNYSYLKELHRFKFPDENRPSSFESFYSTLMFNTKE